MDIENELLSYLQNGEETFRKKLLFANNAFKSSELPVQCKSILLKWILNCKDDSKVVWLRVQDWFSSNNFKDITRNEIDSKDINEIVEVMILKIISEDEDISTMRPICDTLLYLLGNRIFEQYFKVDPKLFLKLIDSILIKIQCPNYFTEFLNKNIFYKSLLTADGFLDHFLNIVFPTLVKCIVKFGDKHVFLQISKVVQKCIFYNNHKNYGNSINHFFENRHEDEVGLQILLKYLLKLHESSRKSPDVHYKLAFHAFVVAYENDSLLIYKFFVILMHITGFNYDDVLPLTSPLVPERYAITEKSRNILLELLDVLEETKLDLRSKLNEVTVTELLKTILENSIFTDKPSALNYRIVKEIVILDPTITQTLTEEILKYTLLANNASEAEEYEQLLLVIFDTFSKLHRIENLISKIVSVLNNHFDKSTHKNKENFDLKIENVLTKRILESFSRNIESLASWQVINVFKTFLFSLKRVVQNKDGLQSDNVEYCFHLEFLSELMGTFLSSIRVAEHTVAANVVEKTKKCLEELEDVLRNFGSGLLNRKHNCSLMRSFLNIAFHWAEISIVLKYYSVNQDDKPKISLDYNFAACNITYVHPYLTVDEWCLISERITNFGELSCKQLLYKLFIQKVRTLCIFEQKVNDEILQDLSRYLTRDLEDSWTFILRNKFLVNNLLPLMDSTSINLLAEKLVTNISDFEHFHTDQHILNSTLILNAVVYAVIAKCDKIVSKRKRKLDEDASEPKKISSKICNVMKLNIFYNEDGSADSINKMRKIYDASNKVQSNLEVKFNESKVLELLEVLKKFPVVFCRQPIQKLFLLYIFALHKDMKSEFLKGNYETLQTSIENLILGVLQQYKYKLDDLFTVGTLCQEILTNFNEWRETFVLVMESIFKNKDAVVNHESLILDIADKLHTPTGMHCGIIILNILNKLKKVKMSKETKTVVDNYKSIIFNRMFELVSENDPQDYLIPGYAYILKTCLAQNEEEKVSKLLTVLDSYTKFALRKHEEFDKVGYLQLFNTILQNKTKLKSVTDDLPLEIWKVCKRNEKLYSRFDEYSQLILLIVCYVSNDDFSSITQDLLGVSEHVINKGKYEQLVNILKTWESILISNINPVKTKSLQDALEILLSHIMLHFAEDSGKYNKELLKSILNFQITIVQTIHFHISPALVDILILNINILSSKEQVDFQQSFNLAISLLFNLLKYRKSLIMDRLPPYLQQFRVLLKVLCVKSDADVPKEEEVVRQLSDCAFQLEKLTKSLVSHQKDMSRIAMYMIADILEQYEKITILTNVKMHLNNCVYSLITICDQHAVSYLMRVLSSASTEIFKVMYDHYKKYYRFTGKA